MKPIHRALLGILPLIALTSLGAQQAKGDQEVALMGVVVKTDDSTMTLAQGTYGVFVTDHLEIGISPMIGKFDDYNLRGGTLFMSYSWLPKGSKFVPYVGASVFKQTVSGPDFDGGVTGFGPKVGFKYFFTPKAAFNLNIEGIRTKDDDTDEKTTTYVALLGFSYLF